MTAHTDVNPTAPPNYLGTLAYLGMTRHLGASPATNKVAKLCESVLLRKGFYDDYGYAIFVGRKP